MKYSVMITLSTFVIHRSHALLGSPCLLHRKSYDRLRSVASITQLHANDSKKGVYARPSAAIERGSGFFVPGLEGPRLRLFSGLAVLALTVINHVTGDAKSSSFTETLAVVYSILLLLQAAIEFGKEEMGFVVSVDRSDMDSSMQNTLESLRQQWTKECNFSIEWKEKVQWCAISYIALTPAKEILLLDQQNVLYSLGSNEGNRAMDHEARGCSAAIETLSKARSGRVSLPGDHPVVSFLAPEARCVILQSINERQCWMIVSDQLVQAFTSQDLRWLGQFARYVWVESVS